MREIKYPLAQMVGKACGRKSRQYAMALALEQWAFAHGYTGYRRHIRRTREQRNLQTRLQLSNKRND